jgi:hypothetical protein
VTTESSANEEGERMKYHAEVRGEVRGSPGQQFGWVMFLEGRRIGTLPFRLLPGP